MAALEAEAQAAAAQAEAEGRKHPGVPDDKAQRNFTDTESRIIPAPGEKGASCKRSNCQAVVPQRLSQRDRGWLRATRPDFGRCSNKAGGR